MLQILLKRRNEYKVLNPVNTAIITGIWYQLLYIPIF